MSLGLPQRCWLQANSVTVWRRAVRCGCRGCVALGNVTAITPSLNRRRLPVDVYCRCVGLEVPATELFLLLVLMCSVFLPAWCALYLVWALNVCSLLDCLLLSGYLLVTLLCYWLVGRIGRRGFLMTFANGGTLQRAALLARRQRWTERESWVEEGVPSCGCPHTAIPGWW
jgi:hypothetical protein